MPDIEPKEEQKEVKEIKKLNAQIAALRSLLASKMWIGLSTFRYALALLLVTVKLGVLAYIQPNPLADVHWFWILLPAFIIELAIGATFASIMVLAFVLAIVGGVIFLLVMLGQKLYFKFVYRRNEKKREDRLMREVTTGETEQESQLHEKFLRSLQIKKSEEQKE